MDDEIDNGKVFEIYLFLKGLQRAYRDTKDQDVVEDLGLVVELLSHLSSENDVLKKKVFDLEKRLECVNWSFCGGIQ